MNLHWDCDIILKSSPFILIAVAQQRYATTHDNRSCFYTVSNYMFNFVITFCYTHTYTTLKKRKSNFPHI
jgi:hypothetical protein